MSKIKYHYHKRQSLIYIDHNSFINKKQCHKKTWTSLSVEGHRPLTDIQFMVGSRCSGSLYFESPYRKWSLQLGRPDASGWVDGSEPCWRKVTVWKFSASLSPSYHVSPRAFSVTVNSQTGFPWWPTSTLKDQLQQGPKVFLKLKKNFKKNAHGFSNCRHSCHRHGVFLRGFVVGIRFQPFLRPVKVSLLGSAQDTPGKVQPLRARERQPAPPSGVEVRRKRPLLRLWPRRHRQLSGHGREPAGRLGEGILHRNVSWDSRSKGTVSHTSRTILLLFFITLNICTGVFWSGSLLQQHFPFFIFKSSLN